MNPPISFLSRPWAEWAFVHSPRIDNKRKAKQWLDRAEQRMGRPVAEHDMLVIAADRGRTNVEFPAGALMEIAAGRGSFREMHVKVTERKSRPPLADYGYGMGADVFKRAYGMHGGKTWGGNPSGYPLPSDRIGKAPELAIGYQGDGNVSVDIETESPDMYRRFASRVMRKGVTPSPSQHVVVTEIKTDDIDKLVLDTLQSKDRIRRELSDGTAEAQSEASDVWPVAGRAYGRWNGRGSHAHVARQNVARTGQGEGESEVPLRPARPVGDPYGFGSPDPHHQQMGKEHTGRGMSIIDIKLDLASPGGARAALKTGSDWDFYQGYSATAPELDRLIAELGKVRDQIRVANRPKTKIGGF